jgi:hypothetical protein
VGRAVCGRGRAGGVREEAASGRCAGPLQRHHHGREPHILEALAKLGDSPALGWARVFYKDSDPLVRAAVEKQLAEELSSAKKKH